MLVLLSGLVIYLNPNLVAMMAACVVGAISFFGFMIYLDELE